MSYKNNKFRLLYAAIANNNFSKMRVMLPGNICET